MSVSLVGLLMLAIASSFAMLLIAAAMVGLGSSIFHPESSRVARMASGGQHGLAQSLFQVGGNAGSSLGPLLAAFIVVPHGQQSIAWFSLVALLGILILVNIGGWYKRRAETRAPSRHQAGTSALPQRRILLSIAVLVALVFSKYFYL